MARRVLVAVFLLGILALANASRVQADGVQMDSFTYTYGGDTYTWELPASPTPDTVEPDVYFIDDNVPVSVDDGASAPESLYFFTTDGLGGFAIPDLSVFTYGAQVFSLGSSGLSDPTFTPGTYTLDNDYVGGPTGTLVIAAVPEPGTLLLLGVGMLGLAAGAKRKMCSLA